jgi:hypothetical protein
MINFLLPFVGSILFVAGFAFLLQFYTTALWTRVAGLMLFLASAPGSWFLISSSLSFPKPVSISFIEKIQDKEVVMVSAHYDIGNAIYVWVIPAEETTIRSYSLPWNEPLAKKLQDGMKAAELNNSQLRVKGLFTKSDADNPSNGAEVIVPQIIQKPERKVLLDESKMAP